jgi:hypothetical protein
MRSFLGDARVAGAVAAVVLATALGGCLNDAVHACARWCDAQYDKCPRGISGDGCYLKYCEELDAEDDCLAEIEAYYACAEQLCAGCFTDYSPCLVHMGQCPRDSDR